MLPAQLTKRSMSFSRLAAIIFALVSILFFASATTTLAATQPNPTFVNLQQAGSGYSSTGSLSAPHDLRLAVFEVIRFALGLIGTIVLVLALYAGFLWFSAEGNAEQVQTAKTTLRNLAIGWLLIACCYGLVSFVFQSIFVTAQPITPSINPNDIGGTLNNQLNPASGVIGPTYTPPSQ